MTGKHLRDLRRGSDVTVTDLARQLKLSRWTIHKYESRQTVPAEWSIAYMDAVAAIVVAAIVKGRAA